MLLGLSGCWLSATSNPVCLSSVLDVWLPGCLVASKSFCYKPNDRLLGCQIALLSGSWLLVYGKPIICLVIWLLGQIA
jgi:hypothetical protein